MERLIVLLLWLYIMLFFKRKHLKMDRRPPSRVLIYDDSNWIWIVHCTIPRVKWGEYTRGIYSGQPKKFPPPPLKLFPVIADFFAVIKAALRYFNVCFITLFLPFPFLQILPVFQFGQKIPPLGNGQNLYPWHKPSSAAFPAVKC